MCVCFLSWVKPAMSISGSVGLCCTKKRTRISKALVFGTKQLLITWGFEKSGIWADPETLTVWVGNDMAIKGTVTNNDLTLEYGTDWETYLNDQAHPQFKELIVSQKAKLTTAASPTKGLGKGTGKSKTKSKSKNAGR